MWECLAVKSGSKKNVIGKKGEGSWGNPCSFRRGRGEEQDCFLGPELCGPWSSVFSHTVWTCVLYSWTSHCSGSELEARVLPPCEWTAISRPAPAGRGVQALFLCHLGVTLSGLEIGLWWGYSDSWVFVRFLPRCSNLVYSSLERTPKSTHFQSKHFGEPGMGGQGKPKSIKWRKLKYSGMQTQSTNSKKYVIEIGIESRGEQEGALFLYQIRAMWTLDFYF